MSRKLDSPAPGAQPGVPSRRKRGAQPGNANALKHGFYARHFNPNEVTRLEHIQDGLADEINLLRLAMQRLVALATAEERSAADWQKTLQALGLASQRLAQLVRLHQELTGAQDLETGALFATIHEVMNKNGWGQS
jgi:hypothetical protein